MDPKVSTTADKKRLTVALLGNPNCGKTTLFNALTASHQSTGNWAGVTVEKKTGHYEWNKHRVDVIDLPGCYSLDIGTSSASLDEKVTRDFLLSGDADLIINIIDASNLPRSLYITLQLIEMRCPFIIVLNMIDFAKNQGISFQFDQLSAHLQCKLIPMTASDKNHSGYLDLKDYLNKHLISPCHPNESIIHKNEVAQALDQIQPLCENLAKKLDVSPRWFSIKLLEGDPNLEALLEKNDYSKFLDIKRNLESEKREDADILIADSRYEFINTITRDTMIHKRKLRKNLTSLIDSAVLGRFTGIPIFLLVMYGMFTFSIKVGAIFQDFIQGIFELIFVKMNGACLTFMHAPKWLVALSMGAGQGVAVVSSFIPMIGALFLYFALLEDSGYLARAAFIVDRLMKKIGLPGKAFIPLIVGFGCNVPAIMATRTLHSEKDRKISILMNPFMSCSARLQVFSLLAMIFFPHNGHNIVFLLYCVGILAAVFTGFIVKKTLLPGQNSPFIMELPAYHLPVLSSIFLKSWRKLKAFILSAGKTVVVIVAIISAINTLGKDGSVGNENTSNSLLSRLAQYTTPIFRPIGIQEKNWPAIVGIFTGIVAKEALAGTIVSLYDQNNSQQIANNSDFNISSDVLSAFATISNNFDQWIAHLGTPLTFSDTSTVDRAIQHKMVNYFGSQSSIFAYLLFILLYFPCVATMGVIKREIGTRWMLFSTFWNSYLAYVFATVFYQTSVFLKHPVYSSICISSATVSFLIIIFLLKMMSKHLHKNNMDTDKYHQTKKSNLKGDIYA